MDTDDSWSLLLDLLRLFNSLHSSLDRAIRDHTELRIEQGVILCTIDMAGSEMTVSGLAAALGRANHTVSVVLARLERRGLVERVKKAGQDQRRVWVRLTEEGQRVLAAFRATRPGILARFLDLNDEQEQQVRRAITLLRPVVEEGEGR